MKKNHGILIAFLLLAAPEISAMGDLGTVSKGESSSSGTRSNGGAQLAPGFTLSPVGGGPDVSLDSFKGQVVFLDFWASWCPPCRNAAPYVDKLHAELGGNAVVLGLNLDNDPGSAAEFIKSKGLNNTQLSASGTAVPAKYGVRGIPAFFIIDKQGNIAKRYVGFAPGYYDEWKSLIMELKSR